MSTVAYGSPFVPPEWIAAHGLQPRRILPPGRCSGPVLGAEAGVCAVASSFANEAIRISAAGIVFATTCDAMRHAAELAENATPHRRSTLPSPGTRSDSSPPSPTSGQGHRPHRASATRPVFLLNVPATWQTVAAQKLYLSELRRLGAWLVEIGGCAPDHARLTALLRQWDDARAAARTARPALGARAFAEALAEMHETGRFPETRAAQPRLPADRDTAGLPVALVGGPLLHDEFWIYDSIEAGGGRIVFDATETGERGLVPPLDRRRLADDGLLALADIHFGQLPDVFRRPNTRLYEYLRAGFAGRGVEAVILLRRVGCDLWHAEAARIREWCPLPCIEIDLTGEGDVRARATTTVQTLCEGRA